MRVWPFAVGGGALVLGGGIVALVLNVKSCMTPKITGTIESTGGQLGTWTLEPASCQSGEHYQFFGVDFYDDSGGNSRLRVVIPASGEPTVSVRIPTTADTVLTFNASQCKRLAPHVERTNVKVNNITQVEGTLDIDCATSDGGSVRGHVEFEHCH